MLVEFGLEALKKREGVGCATGKAGENPFLVDATHLTRAGLDDDIAERHLAITAHSHPAATPNRQNSSAVILLHEIFLVLGEYEGCHRLQTDHAEQFGDHAIRKAEDDLLAAAPHR